MAASWDAGPVVARVRATVGSGGTEEAARVLGAALRADPQDRSARRELVLLLVASGRWEEALPWCDEPGAGAGADAAVGADADAGADDEEWLPEAITVALERRDFPLAEGCALLFARLRWGSSDPAVRSVVPLSVPKLRHDIDQMLHLRHLGVLGAEYDPVVDAYRSVHDRLAADGPGAREPLDTDANRAIAPTYNRLLHVRDTPRVARALSGRWDPATVEEQYVANAPGVVTVDDFLSQEALDELYRFSLESTVWFGNRYDHGRLGSLMQDGFVCPLLTQIAEELRAALPRLIGDRYPLRQIWGFKCGPEVPADVTTHADFAAVNVNFWITPDAANADEHSGGLVVHDVDAPLSWGFDSYNGRQDLIRPFLRSRGARSITIPYRQNRAVIFNSDLFHASDAVRFRPGYENLRINVTMLYGDREEELHHPRLSGPATPGLRPAWRSAALARTRARA
ncbi:tetratricopeptide repeat protein [Streptomyces sp. NBC_00250]|uniref:tetratricopeptide repeat protein n=1 Tax=Streptomyces sp. NBC_00250 TaxID=2903641 RepID=UPI002E2CF0BC|nr:tetratricopeptide repeat protein [Streptomyces sp. NBC_00250]